MGLPVGTYRIRVAGIGYRIAIYERVTVQLGRATDLGEMRLEPQTVNLPELVITGRPSNIGPTTTAIGLNLSAETFEALPTERDYRSIIALLPQANASFYGDGVNIGGSTGSENVYYIDGVNVTDSWTAAAGTSLPYNFVEEIQVKAGGYEAEFGKSLGGIINVVTSSPKNRFNAKAFGFVTNHRLAADYRPGLLEARVPAFSTYDMGLSASGPVVPGRLFILAAYNPSFERKDVELLNLGVYPDRKTAHVFAGKLMWRAASTTDLTLSVFGDPTSQHRVGPSRITPDIPGSLSNADPFLGVIRWGGINGSLTAHSTPAPWLALEASAARYDRTDRETPETQIGSREPYYWDQLTNTLSGGFGSTVDDARNSRTTGKLAATFFRGPHTVKAGAEYEDNRLDYEQATTSPGLVLLVAPSTYVAVTLGHDNAARNRVPSFFLQDSWRASDRLVVNAGLRWDGQYLIGAGDSVAQAITNQFQPRLGVSFQPGRIGSQRISGSFGRFYQQMPLWLSHLEHVVNVGCSSLYPLDPRLPGAQPIFTVCFTPPASPRGSKVNDVDGEHFDEFTLSYESQLPSDAKLVLRGVHRVLRAAYTAGIKTVVLATGPVDSVYAGNPGRGPLSFLPDARREYTAAEVSVQRLRSRGLSFLANYVLSRSYGNYTGLFAADVRRATPGWNYALMRADQATNSTGPLPNDRPHVLKLWGSYRINSGFSAGTFFTWESGTPLAETGPANALGGDLWPVFLVPRGWSGRTPAIWDVSLRLAHDVRRVGLGSGRVIADLLHVGSPRTVVDVDQRRFVGFQGNANPTFGRAIRYQPPMQLRVGLEWQFRQ